jgi:hypothetical protein
MQCRETKWHREQFPDGVEVMDAMIALALEENAYQRDADPPGPGEYKTPKMSRAHAKEWAIRVALGIKNKGASQLAGAGYDPYWILNSAFKQAVELGGNNDPVKFGHGIAFEAMGSGVAWTDDNPDPGFKVPQIELY